MHYSYPAPVSQPETISISVDAKLTKQQEISQVVCTISVAETKGGAFASPMFIG